VAANALNVYKMSVNNLTARVLVRAAGLEFEELDARLALARPVIAEPLDVSRAFFLDGKTFIGAAAPSIADIRLAATLEFLHAIDYEFPAWARDYMTAVETALGDAYSEPAADVRGYIDYVRSQSTA